MNGEAHEFRQFYRPQKVPAGGAFTKFYVALDQNEIVPADFNQIVSNDMDIPSA